MLCELQTDSYRIWTQVTMFISYNGNHYTISIFIKNYFIYDNI